MTKLSYWVAWSAHIIFAIRFPCGARFRYWEPSPVFFLVPTSTSGTVMDRSLVSRLTSGVLTSKASNLPMLDAGYARFAIEAYRSRLKGIGVMFSHDDARYFEKRERHCRDLATEQKDMHLKRIYLKFADSYARAAKQTDAVGKESAGGSRKAAQTSRVGT